MCIRDRDELLIVGADSVKENLVLPTEGKNGTSITWESSDENCVKKDGTVKRPVGADKKVTLIATINRGKVSDTKEFSITVVGKALFKELKVDHGTLVYDKSIDSYTTVSYTHLDVYKRQYFYRTGTKSRRQCQKCRESGKGNGGKGLFRRSAKFRNERSVKIHSCKEEWVKDKNSWNTQEIIWHIRASDQKSGGNGYQHIMRNPFDIRRNYAPDKERHNVPKRKLRTQQIQAGIFVKKSGIHKIVKKFIDRCV